MHQMHAPHVMSRAGSNSPLVSLFLPSLGGGGAERVMVHLARGFADENFAVDLVLASASGPYLDGVSPQVRIVDLASSRTVTSLIPFVRYLRRARPVAVISALERANFVALCAGQIARSRALMLPTIHTHIAQAAKNASFRRGRIVPTLARLLYPHADALVAVSEGVREELLAVLRISTERVRVIHNPVITPELPQLAAQPTSHPWLNDDGPPLLLAMGRLAPPKDFRTLLYAVKRVNNVRPVRLMILGEGPQREQISELATRLGLEATLLGFAPNPYPFLKAASLLVVSSTREGMPTVITEALALATPVVATDCSRGVSELLEGGKWGGLVKVGSVPDLAKGILDSLSSPPQKSGSGAHLRAFDYRYATRRYLSLMYSINRTRLVPPMLPTEI